MVDLSLEPTAAKDGRKSKRQRGGGACTAPPQDTSIIVCESEARAQAVAAVSTALNEDYVVFKILFVEGVTRCGGGLPCMDGMYGGTAESIAMVPAFISVGDHGNIFSIRAVARTSPPPTLSMKDLHGRMDMDEDFVAVMKEGTYEDYEFDGDGEHQYSLGLQVAVDPNDVSRVHNVLSFTLHQTYQNLSQLSLVYLPGSDAGGNADDHGEDHAEEDAGLLFHRDADDKTCFTEQEAYRASEHIAAMALDERVKSALNQQRFELPQQTEEVQSFFCNESVYGKLNLLWVSGVVRMSPGDAWTFQRANEEALSGPLRVRDVVTALFKPDDHQWTDGVVTKLLPGDVYAS